MWVVDKNREPYRFAFAIQDLGMRNGCASVFRT